jgi:hypothetical protein
VTRKKNLKANDKPSADVQAAINTLDVMKKSNKENLDYFFKFEENTILLYHMLIESQNFSNIMDSMIKSKFKVPQHKVNLTA